MELQGPFGLRCLDCILSGSGNQREGFSKPCWLLGRTELERTHPEVKRSEQVGPAWMKGTLEGDQDDG